MVSVHFFEMVVNEAVNVKLALISVHTKNRKVLFDVFSEVSTQRTLSAEKLDNHIDFLEILDRLMGVEGS